MGLVSTYIMAPPSGNINRRLELNLSSREDGSLMNNNSDYNSSDISPSNYGYKYHKL